MANIEIINAVMPLMEEYGGVQRYHQNLNRVFNWLKTNRRDISGNRQDKHVTITGWPTDKISHSGRIDLWMGARALEFLHGYEGLLQESINDRSLESYNVKQACDIKISWEDLIDPELCEPYHKRTTTRIYKGYVQEFKESLSSPRNAMVLYGPPGTSKTTLAQCIAKELDWRLVTITPSQRAGQRRPRS